MATQTGPSRFEAARHLIDEEYDALKAGFDRIVNRVMTEPDGSPSPAARVTERAIEVIKAHPFVAAAVGLGMGYLLVRALRR